MSSSVSFMPLPAEPPTTKSKSSFSEIESIHEPSLYHFSISDPDFISSSLYTPQFIEPFISPLTETNLNYHKSTFSSDLEIKQHQVESFIQNQKALLQEEQELQRKTKAEIQSLIPLDTRSFDEELILDDSQQHWAELLSSSTITPSRKRFSFSSLPSPTSYRHGRTALIQSWFSNIVDYKGHETKDNTLFSAEEQHISSQGMNDNSNSDIQKSSKKQWLKLFTQWIQFGQDKKRDKTIQNKDNHQQQCHYLHHQPQFPLSLATMTTTKMNQDKLQRGAIVNSTLDNDYQLFDERHHQSKKITRHVSWSVSRMKGHGFHGNGTKQHHSFLPTRYGSNTVAVENTENPPLQLMITPTTTSFLPHSAPTSPTSSTTNHQKRRLSFPFGRHSFSSSTKSLLHSRKRLTQQRKRKVYHVNSSQDNIQVLSLQENDSMVGGNEVENNGMITYQQQQQQQQQQPLKKDTHRRWYSSGHLIGRYSPRLSVLKEETNTMATNRNYLVAFRYPRMVRMENLRDTAQHILSVEGDDGHYIGSRNWISGQHLYNKTGADDQDDNDDGAFGVEKEGDMEDDDDDSLIKYSRQYTNYSKRFSDPGGLSAPPFPIGRPLSSLYD